MKPTLVISLKKLENNFQFFHKSLSAQSSFIINVLKRNAYGMGLKRISQHLIEKGAKHFMVSSFEEACMLKSYLKPQRKFYIYILNGFSQEEYSSIAHNSFIPIANDLFDIEGWLSFCYKSCFLYPYGLHIDTGMNRLALPQQEIKKASLLIRKYKHNPLLVMSHLISAQTDKDLCIQQRASFITYSKFFKYTYKGLSATRGMLMGRKFFFDFCRIGIGLFTGYYHEKLHDIFYIRSPIIQIFQIKEKTSVGYNQYFVAKKNMLCCTALVGYGDGVFYRGITNACCYIHNIRCPIIGRVSMDLISIDISHIKQPVHKGDNIYIYPQDIYYQDNIPSPYIYCTGIGACMDKVYVNN